MIEERKKVNLKNEEFKIIKSVLEVNELMNHEGTDIATYINFDNKIIETLESGETINEKMVKIPTVEELSPFNTTMHEYIEKMEISIPLKETAASYLRRNKIMGEFYIFRQEKAVEVLKQWLQEYKIKIVLENI